MSVEFKDGDLFATSGLTAYAHGCNCAGAMGKGIAVAFKERWPAMYAEYRRRCLGGSFGLGDVFLWEEGGVHVFNLGTQKTWRTKATMPAVRDALETMLTLGKEKGVAEVALPRIGAGLGGLEWLDVKRLLIDLAAKSPINLIVCENFIQGQSLR